MPRLAFTYRGQPANAGATGRARGVLLAAWRAPPAECDAVWLPGGYPELHAESIAANTGLRASLTAHVQQRKPLWAECGGMMALFESITLTDGTQHPGGACCPAM